jgi:hypothetical protein
LLLGWTHTTPVSTTPDEPYAYSVPNFGQPLPVSYSNSSYDTTDNILKYRVRDLVRSDIGVVWKQLSAGFSVRYNSHVRNIDRVFVDLDAGPPSPDILPVGASEWMRTHTTGDWLVDARLGFKLTSQLKASVIVSNLSNEVYSIRPMSIEAPRSWQIQLAWER